VNIDSAPARIVTSSSHPMATLKRGDRVTLHGDPNGPVAIVRAVHEGGSVVLQSALAGYRCWNHADLDKVTRD
jgi:hypothetical protein